MKAKYYVIQKREDKIPYPLEDARKRAMELALKYPDDEFKILMEVCTTKVPTEIETWTDGMTIEELASLRTNPEWKDAPDNCVHSSDNTHYIKDAGKWYRILKRSETIPENAQFLDVNKWHFTANSGQKQTHSESLYRVPSEGPPIPGCEDKDPLLGDFRWMNLKKNSLGGEVSIGGEEYMREGEQWFRLMKAGEKIPQYAQYRFKGNPAWCQTVLSGAAVDLSHGRSYRVKCDPPHGAFRGTLKPT